MAIPRVVIAATAISLLLLLVIQSLYLVYSEDIFGQTKSRWPLSNSKDDGLKSLEIGDEYLLGVGKADITGYAKS
jgi:hypothetical protein